MEEHNVPIILVREHATFRGKKVIFNANCLYCNKTEEFYVDEELMQKNDMKMKDACELPTA